MRLNGHLMSIFLPCISPPAIAQTKATYVLLSTRHMKVLIFAGKRGAVAVLHMDMQDPKNPKQFR